MNVAMVMWFAVGAITCLAGVATFVNSANISAPPLMRDVFALVFIAMGVAVIVLSLRLRHPGSGAPIAVAVIGSLSFFVCFTLPFIVAGIVLLLVPGSRAWWRGMSGAASPPDPRPGAGGA